MLPNIHILGIQGSGKGTQAHLLVQKYKLSYISSGDLFRERSLKRDAFGQEILQEMGKGRLLPDSFLVQTVKDHLEEFKPEIGLLGDGVIRSLKQNLLLNNLWPNFNLEQPLLINLILSEEEAQERIAKRKREQELPEHREHYLKYGGKTLKRIDDNPEAISQRFALFHQLTEPVIEHFTKTSRIINIDAKESVEVVFDQISFGLENIYPNLKCL